jgi:hypothetical protein
MTFRFDIASNNEHATIANIVHLGDVPLNDTDIVAVLFIESLLENARQTVSLSSSIANCRFQLENENIAQLSRAPLASRVYQSSNFNQVLLLNILLFIVCCFFVDILCCFRFSTTLS